MSWTSFGTSDVWLSRPHRYMLRFSTTCPAHFDNFRQFSTNFNLRSHKLALCVCVFFLRKNLCHVWNIFIFLYFYFHTEYDIIPESRIYKTHINSWITKRKRVTVIQKLCAFPAFRARMKGVLGAASFLRSLPLSVFGFPFLLVLCLAFPLISRFYIFVLKNTKTNLKYLHLLYIWLHNIWINLLNS